MRPSGDLATDASQRFLVCADPPIDDDDWFSELTRSRDWKITRTNFVPMDFGEMWSRASGIFTCSVLMVIVVITMIDDPLGFGINWMRVAK